MAYQPETTYASQLITLESRMVAIRQQIEAEQDSIAAAQRPGSLLQALFSAPVREAALQEVYRSRGRIALLERDLVQAEYEKKELERLRATFPEHDLLIEQDAQLRYRSWHLSLQEDEMNLEEGGTLVAERLEQKRLQKEEERIQQELNALAQQQEELEKKRVALARKAGTLKKASSVKS